MDADAVGIDVADICLSPSASYLLGKTFRLTNEMSLLSDFEFFVGFFRFFFLLVDISTKKQHIKQVLSRLFDL